MTAERDTRHEHSMTCDELARAALAALNRDDCEVCVGYAGRAVTMEPRNGFLRQLLGVALSRLERWQEALGQLEYACQLSPEDAQTHYNLAVALHKAGHCGAAMAAYRRCLESRADHADALWNYGELLRLGEHFEGALACLDQLLRLEGAMRPKAAHRMAVCCAHLGLDTRAEALFLDQLRADPAPNTHWEYALFCLERGRFDDAWPHYAWRFEAQNCAIEMATPFAPWHGGFEADATLIVSNEQGAGDEILFAAFLPELLARAARACMQVVLVCHPGLARLFAASFQSARVIPRNTLTESSWASVVDTSRPVWHCPIGNLPQWIGKPAPAAYLKPHADDIRLAETLFGPEDGMRVGLAWTSNPRSQDMNSLARNVPSDMLNAWLKDLPHIRFHSLMTTEHRGAVGSLADVPLRDLSWFLSDFSRTAALMCCLDAVVSVCTSTANLAGALGVESHVLLQKHADWRWYRDTAWYPRVVTYRQERRSDWSPCLRRLRDYLAGRSI